jgi:hypothetical protein
MMKQINHEDAKDTKKRKSVFPLRVLRVFVVKNDAGDL